jgi:Tol biopolymer transport system component
MGQPEYTALPPAPDISAGFSNGVAAWSPDGRRLAVVSQNTNLAAAIWIVTPDSSAPFQKLVELATGPRIRGLSWTRDGTAVIFGQHDSSGDIVLLDGN